MHTQTTRTARPFPNCHEVPTAFPTNNPSVQTTNTVLMVTPMNFCYNFETAQDNSFMKTLNISGNAHGQLFLTSI